MNVLIDELAILQAFAYVCLIFELASVPYEPEIN